MRTLLAALAALAVTTTAAISFADVIPPDEAACQGKSAGATCALSTGETGACQNATCSKITYYPDGGMGSSDYPCLQCTASDAGTGADTGVASDASPTSDAGSSGGGGGSSGCSIGHAGSVAGAFALALVVPILVRRRRRS